jgi:hypothetical protein
MSLYDLDTNELAIAASGCGMLLSLRNLLLSMCDGADSRSGRAKGVSEGYILFIGEQFLRRLRVAFLKLIHRQAQSLD